MLGALYLLGGSFFPDTGLERTWVAGEKGALEPEETKFPGTNPPPEEFIVIFRIVW